MAEHVACMRENKNAYRVWVRKGQYEDRNVGGRIILKWIFEKQDWMVWTGFIWLRTGSSEISVVE
jgi:hypothetical protein